MKVVILSGRAFCVRRTRRLTYGAVAVLTLRPNVHGGGFMRGCVLVGMRGYVRVCLRACGRDLGVSDFVLSVRLFSIRARTNTHTVYVHI